MFNLQGCLILKLIADEIVCVPLSWSRWIRWKVTCEVWIMSLQTTRMKKWRKRSVLWWRKLTRKGNILKSLLFCPFNTASQHWISSSVSSFESLDMEMPHSVFFLCRAKKGGFGGMFGMLKGLVGSKNLTQEDMEPVLDKMRDHLIGMTSLLLRSTSFNTLVFSICF